MKRCFWLLVVGCGLVFTSVMAQDSTKAQVADSAKIVYPDTLYQDGILFFSSGPNFPTRENGYVYYIGPNQGPLWRAAIFPRDFDREIVGFSMITSRFDKNSTHKYDLTLYAITDTASTNDFQVRTYRDTTKAALGTMTFSTGNKPPQIVGKPLDFQKIDTTIVMLKAGLDPFGSLVLSNNERLKLRGVLGFMIKRPPAQSLDDSKTVGAFYRLGIITREKGKKQVELVDLTGVRGKFIEKSSEQAWVYGFLALFVVGIVALMIRKKMKRT